ncbi:PDZ domain-containing protein [Paenibacillus beijingensis]|uniref:Serine protease n=1 Tax=Paenibacillus beijingensis TaxID=1126833 RepID=A0A0D5NRR1_9BACL|nr:PDZ domain-containing protein [Paenibacillus beijingensis]AJY77593.1 serine protease [Paenibacillus beijingensis]
METAQELLEQAWRALMGLIAQPFYYVAGLLIVLHYIRQTRMERKLFHVRLHIWPRLLVRAIVAGALAGAAVSAAGVFIGLTLTPDATLWLWGMTLVLLLLRVRYLCFAYSAGLLGLLQWGAGFTPLGSHEGVIGTFVRSLAELDIPGLLLLVALLHAAEALLVRAEGARLATPLFLEGKRGKLVGGYALQGYWPVPLLLLMPAAAGGSAAGIGLPWTPLLGGTDGSGGWTLIALPAIIGFTELTRSVVPGSQARLTARNLLVYSMILAALAAGSVFWPPLVPAAAICSLVLHEVLIRMGVRRERERSPLYVHDERGLRVLGVVPGTPAEQLGIMAGEVLHKVNGRRVRTKEDLHAALHINSAFCKLELFNLEGQLKFTQRARYEGEHHQLGVILAPDEDAGYYAAPAPASLLDLVRRSRAAHRRDVRETSF